MEMHCEGVSSACASSASIRMPFLFLHQHAQGPQQGFHFPIKICQITRFKAAFQLLICSAISTPAITSTNSIRTTTQSWRFKAKVTRRRIICLSSVVIGKSGLTLLVRKQPCRADRRRGRWRHGNGPPVRLFSVPRASLDRCSIGSPYLHGVFISLQFIST